MPVHGVWCVYVLRTDSEAHRCGIALPPAANDTVHDPEVSA
jgi:hypothetical protein